MLEFIIMNGIHKINYSEKEELTQFLKRFILFTFLGPALS